MLCEPYILYTDTSIANAQNLCYQACANRVKASLKDAELLRQFKAVELFTDDDKTVIKKLIDAFIVKKQLQQMVS